MDTWENILEEVSHCAASSREQQPEYDNVEAVVNYPGPDLKTRMWCYKQCEICFQQEAPGTSQARVGQGGQGSRGRK